MTEASQSVSVQRDVANCGSNVRPLRSFCGDHDENRELVCRSFIGIDGTMNTTLNSGRRVQINLGSAFGGAQ